MKYMAKKQIQSKSHEDTVDREEGPQMDAQDAQDMQQAGMKDMLPQEFPQVPGMPKLTEEERKRIEEKMKEIQVKVRDFEKEALEKFKDYILGIGILPPEKKGQEDIHVLVMVDDSDSKRMTKKELRD